MTPSHISIQSFDDSVRAAFDAWSNLAALRLFFARTRTLLRARNVNLIVYRGDDRTNAYGIHEIETTDLVPELARMPEATWSVPLHNAVSRSQAFCMESFTSGDIYRLYFQPYGLFHSAKRRLSLGNVAGELNIDRAEGEADFSAEELDVIDRLAMHLEHVLPWHESQARGGSRWWLQNVASHGGINADAGYAGEGFGLTPAELRLIEPLTKGSGLSIAAHELGISINTAKSRLRSIFEKTGTHRQAELVSLLLRASR